MHRQIEVTWFFWCIVGYLVGSIPTGFLILKYSKGVDVRNFGSHSTGATNVLRTGGKKQALATLLIDAIKGIVFTLLATTYSNEPWIFVAIFCCIVGHVYPIWLKFNGGKGVATTAGVFLVLSPWFAVVSIVIWAIVAKLTSVSSLASMALGFSFLVMVLGSYIAEKISLEICLFSIMVLLFLFLTHIENVKRLLHHKEAGVTEKMKESKQLKDEKVIKKQRHFQRLLRPWIARVFRTRSC
jgi:glycerol-3-phosphate acyltransferase PlsY